MTQLEANKAYADFERAYGAALAEWGRIEATLFYWFQALTGMDEKTARAVFFSARNFNARADMLEAALDAPKSDTPVKQFLKAVLKKARGYSGFRNSATHGEAVLNLERHSDAVKQMVIIQGRKMSHEAEDTMITVAHLQIAMRNFRALRGVVYEMYAVDPSRRASLLERSLELVQSLPSPPHSRVFDPTPAKPKRPPRS